MSNITEQYRKPLMSDETGKAIADKLGGDSVSENEKVNISEQYRKPLMSEETAQEILAKIGGGSGASALSELSDVNLTSPSDGQVLHYDGTEWINATPVAELPAVTSDDNGDVLTVVEGAWAKASAGGGGNNNFIITFSYDEVESVVADKTYAETLAAMQSGKTIYANVNPNVLYWTENDDNHTYSYVPLNSYQYYGSDQGVDSADFLFCSIEYGNDTIDVRHITLNAFDVVVTNSYTINL